MATEDLDLNPFFKVLNTVYKRRYEEAQRKSWLICLPCASSIAHLKNFNVKFVELHLLRPSPYFYSQYISTDRNESHSFEIENGYITSTSDDSESFRIKVVTEELGYNEDFKQFRILLIEKPLDKSFQANEENKQVFQPNGRHSYEESQKFLYSFPEHKPILALLIKKLKQFNTNYLILPDYLSDAACKLRDIVEWASIELSLSHKPRLRSDEKLADEISYSLGNFIIGFVHEKLYGVICKKFSQNDRLLLEKLNSIKGIQSKDLGINKEFSCPLPKTVCLLKTLDDLRTPASKLNCLHNSLESMSKEIKQCHENPLAILGRSDKKLHLTTDDIIPILVTVLLEARPQALESDLYYIENFQWNTSNKDRLSYSLVTFQAAMEFVKANDFLRKSSQKSSPKKSALAEEAQAYSPKSNDTTGACGLNVRRTSSPVDRELARITKMLEVSTKELAFANTGGVPNTVKKQHKSKENSKESSLGGFLSSIQKNSFGCSYGRKD